MTGYPNLSDVRVTEMLSREELTQIHILEAGKRTIIYVEKTTYEEFIEDTKTDEEKVYWSKRK